MDTPRELEETTEVMEEADIWDIITEEEEDMEVQVRTRVKVSMVTTSSSQQHHRLQFNTRPRLLHLKCHHNKFHSRFLSRCHHLKDHLLISSDGLLSSWLLWELMTIKSDKLSERRSIQSSSSLAILATPLEKSPVC